MPSFFERLGRGLTAGSRTAERTLLPALREQGRIGREDKQRDFRNDLAQAAEDRAQGRFELELADAERLDKIRKDSFFGKLLRLNEAGVDTKSFFPAKNIEDVETAESVGLLGGTSVKRIMGFQSLEDAERAAATQEAQQKSRKTEAGISKTQAETERIRLQSGLLGAPSGATTGVKNIIALNFLSNRFQRNESGAFVIDPTTKKRFLAPLTGPAVDSLTGLLNRADQPLFDEVAQPAVQLTAEQAQHRAALNQKYGEEFVQQVAKRFEDFDSASFEIKEQAIQQVLAGQ